MLVYPRDLFAEDLKDEHPRIKKEWEDVNRLYYGSPYKDEYDQKPEVMWRLKRSSIKRMIQEEMPEITRNDLEYLYQLHGLETESNPANKHYVRCMHD